MSSARATPAASTSLWTETGRRDRYAPVRSTLSTDVVVVGAGITGLTSALLFQRDGRSVVVLEADEVGGGTTGSTSAHVTCVTDTRYARLRDQLGQEGAATFTMAQRYAFETLCALARGSVVPCELEQVPAYLYTESPEAVAGLEAEVEAARELGVGAALTRSCPLPFPVEAAILFPRQARFHPLNFLTGLARQFIDEGGHIFAGSRVTSLEEQNDSVVLKTAGGTVRAGSVILATHTPLGVNLVHTEVAPYCSYLVALQSERRVPDALFWDTASPYHYLRRVRQEGEDLLLLGGEDHKTGQESDPLECYRRLEDYARTRFPSSEVVRRWSSQYYEPADGLPYVGRSPFSKNVFLATGYAGTGLVQGVMAAQVLADLLQGRESDVARLVDATRLRPLAAGPKMVAENLDAAVRFVGDRVGRWDDSAVEIGRGQGGLVEVEGEKLAVYRDGQGALHARSAVCTHLGCIVHWNEAERTWDCPCHGGRFTPTGEVASGPPLAPLPERTLG